ncbi:acyltransferase [Hoeflea sp. YIM 152468]|uniref:acyltransferase family protein n=1 Tax=Hoeflea sp. YIM 152468 TaxID=3031759 RepID=UPI0023DB348F|nr:acyltransferase [Hoeflea sp. YIM 152468]MDF1607120.1 acyltransferase [Hoeflea sp. YIM 152468]
MSAAGSSVTSPEPLYSVQYLRAAAALAVVFYHVSVVSQKAWGLDPERIDHVGAAGVDLFFVISGFIMAMIVARPGVFDGREFWIRRLARVAPAYWVITFLVFVLAWQMPSLFHSTVADPYSLVTSLSFVALEQNGGVTGPLLVVGWTLNYEVFFYAIVALTAGLFSDRRLIGASAAIMVLVAAGLVFDPSNLSMAFYTNPILVEFVFGVLIFHAWTRTRADAPGLLPAALLVTGLALLLWQWERPLAEWRAFYWGVPAAAVLYGGLGAFDFKSAFLARLGDWSYALYLTHVFVVTFYIKHGISMLTAIEVPWPVHYLIMTVLAFAVAAAFYTIVERPLSRWTLGVFTRQSAAKPKADAEPGGRATEPAE